MAINIYDPCADGVIESGTPAESSFDEHTGHWILAEALDKIKAV